MSSVSTQILTSCIPEEQTLDGWIGAGFAFSRESGDRQTVFRTAPPANHQLGRLRSALAAGNTAPIGESTRIAWRRVALFIHLPAF